MRDDSGNVDGLPNIVLEALASGTPLVATPAGGIASVVADGETGLLVPERDPAALAAAIAALAADAGRTGRGSARRPGPPLPRDSAGPGPPRASSRRTIARLPSRRSAANIPLLSMPQRAMRKPGLSVFFPAYNDSGTIASLVITALRTARTLTPDFEVIVVNDGSADDTAAIVDELARTYPEVRVVHHPTNRGYGGALRSGFAARDARAGLLHRRRRPVRPARR